MRPQAMALPPFPAAGGGGGTGSGWRWLLFSFIGPAYRAQFWTGFVVSFGLVIAAFVPLLAAAAEESDLGESEPNGTIVLAFFGLVVLALWIYVAVGVKRWHDRDKSGAWMLLQLVPFGPRWAVIECGFLPGTDGPNRFGQDPLRMAAEHYSASA